MFDNFTLVSNLSIKITFSMIISYIIYETYEFNIEVIAGEVVVKDISMHTILLEREEIQVTA